MTVVVAAAANTEDRGLAGVVPCCRTSVMVIELWAAVGSATSFQLRGKCTTANRIGRQDLLGGLSESKVMRGYSRRRMGVRVQVVLCVLWLT